MLRALGIIIALVAPACLKVDGVHCEDGRLCPAGNTCDNTNHQCLSPVQLDACHGHADGDMCSFGGISGSCRSGGCEPAVCGDGVIEGDEPCDGSDLGGKTCNDFGYSVPAGLTCSSSCTFVYMACTGKCNNGVVEGDELCDGAPPPGSCIDYGFDAGALACNDGCGVSLAGCDRFGWNAEPTGIATQGADLYHVGGTAHDDRWIAGPQGELAHYDGMTWTQVPTGTFEGLFDIEAIAPDDVWIGGANGTVVHWDGTTASTVAAPATASGYAVWATDASHVYIADETKVYARNGTSWDMVGDLTDSINATGQRVQSLRGPQPDDLWADEKDPDSCTLWRWDGSTWSSIALDVDALCQLTDFHVESAADIWAAGTETDVASSVLIHWDGSTASLVPVPLASTTAFAYASDTAMWIFGTTQGGQTAIVYFDGSTMFSVPTTSAIGTVTSAFATGAADATAVTDKATAYEFRGLAFANLSAPPPYPATAFWSSGDDFVTVDGNDVASQFTPTDGWSYTSLASQQLFALWGSSPTDVWAGASGGIYHYNGTSWTQSDSWASNFSANYCEAGWASSPNDVWALQEQHILHFDGSTWSNRDLSSTTGITLHAISGTGPADVWVVNDRSASMVPFPGEVWHWDGTAWTQLAPPDALARAVYAEAPGNAIVLTLDNHAMQWDGTQWTDTVVPALHQLTAIDGTGPTDVFAASDIELWHFDGHVWTPINLPHDIQQSGQPIEGIRVFTDHVDLLVENDGVVVHRLIRNAPL